MTRRRIKMIGVIMAHAAAASSYYDYEIDLAARRISLALAITPPSRFSRRKSARAISSRYRIVDLHERRAPADLINTDALPDENRRISMGKWLF